MNLFPRVLPNPGVGFNVVRVPNAVYVVTESSRGYIGQMGFFTRVICVTLIILGLPALILVAATVWLMWKLFWWTTILIWKTMIWSWTAVVRLAKRVHDYDG